MSQLHINCLPNEILFRIFHELPPQDLKSAVLVSRSWSELGDDPSLWIWAVVAIDSSPDLQKFNIKRLWLLQKVEVNCCGYMHGGKCNWNEVGVNELFKVITEITSVKRITGCSCKNCFSSVDPHLLVSLLNRLEELSIGVDSHSFQLNAGQTDLLFTAMAKETKLKTLVVYEMCNVYKMSPVLGAALSNVANVYLVGFGVDLQHIDALFSAIIGEDRPVRKLDLTYWLMHRIDPHFLARALNRLEEVTIHNVVNSEQMSAIIRILVDGESRLKRLKLLHQDAEDVEAVDQDLIRRAKEKVGEFFTIWEPLDSSDEDFEDNDDVTSN